MQWVTLSDPTGSGVGLKAAALKEPLQINASRSAQDMMAHGRKQGKLGCLGKEMLNCCLVFLSPISCAATRIHEA